MAANRLRKKQGIVILLDALGASEFSDEKIKKFLAARTEINNLITDLASSLKTKTLLSPPSIYTFGDTIVITIQFHGKKSYAPQIFRACLLMRRYLFHSLEHGILFRGAFSIGSYIEDSTSNTVMGEAITDAAQRYELSEWMGIISTPKTNTAIEFYFNKTFFADKKYIFKYPVPIKTFGSVDLYTISWPGAFHDEMLLKRRKKTNARNWFLEIINDFSFPAHATAKLQNTISYFDYIEAAIANPPLNSDPAASGGAG